MRSIRAAPRSVDELRAGRVRKARAEPALTGQDRARLRRVCDYLIDSEDELLYLLDEHPSLRGDVDGLVALLVRLTKLAHE